ncbi:MAG: hypothetical protein A2Y00_04985 [Omnitrophica WOR_2 bacterium GWF2_43_52]|nr:MAG: hypothetical protein A2Y01_01815 [Omnitrophica WOR_2 bacterium GWC2_44_8]OGX20462.1 MAG: hypothetical protein A2Y00_04985 [Omnitrophica WOR_2 bacterium GWF2_43_52]HAH20516.1 hypothetical protein [Candidatus Omnitrophota bacterium]HBG62779.1 hypothetical protein [Candidatus Omnitrophota bacterium]
MRLRTKFLLTFLAISIIPLIFISALSFSYAKKSLEATALKGLNIVALAKKAEVLEYLSGKKGRTIDFASDGFIRDQAEAIFKSAAAEKTRLSRSLNEHLRVNKKPLDEEILEIRVLDITGKIIGDSEGEALLGLATGKTQAYFLEGQHTAYIQDSGIFMHWGAEEEIIAIGTPLKSRTTNTLIGVLVNFYTLANVQDVLLGIKGHRWDKQSIVGGQETTMDIFLVNQQGLLLTPSKKLDTYRPLKTKIITEPVLQATADFGVLNRSWVDMRGNNVLGASVLLDIEEDWKWLLIIEQDQKEVLLPVYELRNFLATAAVIIWLFVGFIAVAIAESITAPVRKLTRVADRISRGEAGLRIENTSKDEIGTLASSFNRMVEIRQSVEDELRLAKTRISEEKTKCELVLASIGEGMIVISQDAKVMMMNSEAEHMFGWELIELVGKNFGEALICEDEKGNPVPEAERIMARPLEDNKTIHVNAYYYRRDATRFPVSVTASPILFESKVIGAIGIFRDITKEKEIDRMKTDFISTVSHEIRTPLTTIREGVSQALDGLLGGITEKQREIFSIVLEDSDRLKRIIDSLLDIAKIEAGKVELKKELVDIAAVAKTVAAAFGLQAQEKKLQIRTHFSKPKIKAYVDRDRINQVFINLVGNALKFTENGSITISVEDTAASIECSVADTGKGIAKEDQPKLFSKFQQFGRAHGPGEKGTGLGLSISKGIVELHKGKIWAESQPRKGTKISFTIPRYSQEQLFKEYVAGGIKKAMRQNNVLSLVLFSLWDVSDTPLSDSDALADNLTDFIRKKIHWDSEAIVESGNRILMLFPGVTKENARVIAGKIRNIFVHYTARQGGEKHITISFKVITYPQDGSHEEGLVLGILNI